MVCSHPKANIILSITFRPVCDPIELLFNLNRCSLPGFRATEFMKLKTPATGLKINNLRFVFFLRQLHFVFGYNIFTLIPRSHLKLPIFPSAIRNRGLFQFQGNCLITSLICCVSEDTHFIMFICCICILNVLQCT